MMRWSKIPMIGIALSLPAHAEEVLQWKGKLWAKLTYDLREDASPKSGFDIYRGFLTAKVKHSDTWSSQITLDSKSTGTKIHLIHTPATLPNSTLFHGFFQGNNLILKDRFRFGIQPSDYLIPVYKFMGTRWLGMLLSQEAGYIGSHQGGVGYSVSLFDQLKISMQVHDGRKGYGKSLEHDGGGAITAQVKILEELQVIIHHENFSSKTLTADDGTKSKNPTNGVTGMAILGKYGGAKLAIEASHKKDKGAEDAATGYGATLNTEFDRIGLVARYYTGNDEFKNSLKADSIVSVGPTMKLARQLKSSLIYEKRKSLDSSKDDISTVSLVMMTSF